MGKRAKTLDAVLLAAGMHATPPKPRPRWVDLERAGLGRLVASVYRSLGGIHGEPRVTPGAWDLQVDDISIELDEERHFNRYRAVTLASAAYERVLFPVGEYTLFCAQHERACLAAATWGRNWTTSTAAREFGEGGAAGDLLGAGSPRWKQRAFYDFVKDLAPLCANISVARLAIWDLVEIEGKRALLGDLLTGLGKRDVQSESVRTALRKLVLERAGFSA